MPEQSAKEKIKEFLSSIITEHNSQLAATYLTKTQAAQIVADSSSEKLTPNLVLGTWNTDGNTYTAPITYTGDGTLSTDIGTIANDILTVEDADGNFSGVISAAEGTNFAPANLTFTHTKENVGGGSGKPVPELYVEDFSAGGLSPLDEIHPLTYTGDTNWFEVYARKENTGDVNDLGVTITGNASTGYQMHVTAPAGFYNDDFILFAYETENYETAYCPFTVDTGD